jgi:hypothetical protein
LLTELLPASTPLLLRIIEFAVGILRPDWLEGATSHVRKIGKKKKGKLRTQKVTPHPSIRKKELFTCHVPYSTLRWDKGEVVGNRMVAG